MLWWVCWSKPLVKEVKTLNENNIKLAAIGGLDSLPAGTYDALMKGIRDTAQNTGMTLVLALNYSSRWEITEAVKKIAGKVKEGILQTTDIDEHMISEHLCTVICPILTWSFVQAASSD